MDLLNLPPKMLDRVLQLLDPCELVLLSCCSTRTKNLISNTKFAQLCACDDHPSSSFIAKFHWPTNVLSMECGLELRRDTDRPMEWTFGTPWRAKLYNQFDMRLKDYMDFECYTLIDKAPGDEFRYWVNITHLPTAIDFTRHILNLFDMPLSEVVTNDYEIDLTEVLNSYILRDANRLTLYAAIRQNELARALHYHIPLYSLGVHWCFREPLDVGSPLLSTPTLHFENGLFVEFEHVRRFGGRYLYVKRSRFTSIGFVEIVKSWQESENRNLRVLLCDQHFPLDREEILSKLNAMEGRRRGEYPLCAYINNQFKPKELIESIGQDASSKDIERRDGVMATVRVVQNRFILMVWPDSV